MADFSSNDINDAKRRVEEMRNRAKNFVNSSDNDEYNKHHEGDNVNSNNNGISGGIGDIFSRISSNNDSSLILALVLVLAREKADNMLILALLYILL